MNNSIFLTLKNHNPIKFANMAEIIHRMFVCACFADILLGHLRELIPNRLPDKSGMMACFQIPLTNGYTLSVAIPTDKNRNLALTDSIDRITVETALFNGDKLVYDDELGYANVLCHDFDAQVILAEYENLMQKLAERA
jgi:hypothetical protein